MAARTPGTKAATNSFATFLRPRMSLTRPEDAAGTLWLGGGPRSEKAWSDLRRAAQLFEAAGDARGESLATILGRHGYRSGFFEMSRGPWEGAPGLFANLGFDLGWFRENLQDRRVVALVLRATLPHRLQHRHRRFSRRRCVSI